MKRKKNIKGNVKKPEGKTAQEKKDSFLGRLLGKSRFRAGKKGKASLHEKKYERILKRAVPEEKRKKSGEAAARTPGKAGENKKTVKKTNPEEKKELLKRRKEKLKLQKKKRIEKRRKYTKREFHKNLIRAGIEATPELVSKRILTSSILFTFIFFIIAIYFASQSKFFSAGYFFLILITMSTLGFGLVYGLVWLLYHQYLDIKIYRRRKEVESVLSDFLLLTSANVRAGMTIDKALWHAVRPRFGVLAREIENVAKKTLSGEDLDKALYEFGESYDSPLLKRSVSLLIEGLNAGGEIGELLNNIALNIQETNILREEMASNVTTYAIFINFATLIAAPFLFALAGELLKVVKELTGRIDVDPALTQRSGFAFSFSGGSTLEYSDFLIFAIITLSITSVFSNVIVATIKKGDAREAIMNVPVSLGVTLALFLIGSRIIGSFLAGVM